MPLLDLAQRQHDNWIPNAAIKKIGEILEVPQIKVYEVATFYTMYNLAPVGKYFVQVCTTSPCMLRGSGKIVNLCKKFISEKEGKLSEDKKTSWIEVECLGACVSAPMMQINDDFYEDLTEETATKIFEGIKIDKLNKKISELNYDSSIEEKAKQMTLEKLNSQDK